MLRPIPEKPGDHMECMVFDMMAAGSILVLLIGLFSGGWEFYVLSFVFLFSSWLGIRGLCSQFDKVYETMSAMISAERR